MTTATRLLPLVVLGLAASSLFLPGTRTDAAGSVEVKSLRGGTPLTDEAAAPPLRDPMKDHAPEVRNYLHQPPLIPHTVRDYKITSKHNKCMECHSWQRYREFGATKISMTHFKDRSGADTATVSPLRYFCNQCHVPQTDARPLAGNSFRPIDSIKPASP